MNQVLKTFAVIVAIIFNIESKNAYGQSSQATNNRDNSSWFLGWNGSGSAGTGPLEIRNDYTDHINFSTNGTQKMTILGNSGSTDGFVGIGTSSPNYLLHLNNNSSTAADVYAQFTNSNSNSGSGKGFLVGIDASNNGIINMQDAAPIEFFTSGKPREIILSNGNVGIGTAAPSHTLEVNGTVCAKQFVVATETEPKDLLVMIEELRKEVGELKCQLVASK